MRKILLFLLLLGLSALSAARADEIVVGQVVIDGVTYDIIDPATLHIGPGAGTPCATGCGGDPNVVGLNQLDIYQNSGGAPIATTPVLLILGVPNNTSNLFASNPISSVTSYNPYSAYPGGSAAGTSAFATGGTYGLKPPATAGTAYFGSMTAGQEVYSFLTLLGPTNNSNSFTNWHDWDQTNLGINATSFGIYVFALNATLGPQGLLDILFSSPLPIGTYAVGYGQAIQVNPNGNPKLFIYDTPFTEAGVAVPEPGTLALLGTGLIGLAGLVRRKLSS